MSKVRWIRWKQIKEKKRQIYFAWNTISLLPFACLCAHMNNKPYILGNRDSMGDRPSVNAFAVLNTEYSRIVFDEKFITRERDRRCTTRTSNAIHDACGHSVTYHSPFSFYSATCVCVCKSSVCGRTLGTSGRLCAYVCLTNFVANKLNHKNYPFLLPIEFGMLRSSSIRLHSIPFVQLCADDPKKSYSLTNMFRQIYDFVRFLARKHWPHVMMRWVPWNKTCSWTHHPHHARPCDFW